MSTLAMRGRPPQNGTGRQKVEREPRTIQLRDFTGSVNIVDSRVAIKDNELSWLENAMSIGNGQIQLLPAPGDAVATLTQGISTLWGETLSNAPIILAVGRDGSLTQVTPGGVVTIIAGAGTLTGTSGATHFAIWRGTTVLILDPTTGFHTWDGTTFTTVDATQTGTAIAVFQGRAWFISERTITFTAPNTFSDFAIANGAGSTILTDEAFAGNINAAVSALEQLWLVGASAVEAIANVTSTGSGPVVTTFSITNIVTNIGSNAQHSVLGYLRSLAFASPFGFYALAGVTPQKISEKLDGLFPSLTIDHDTTSSAVAVIQNLLCLVTLATYSGRESVQGNGPVPLLLIFANGKWSFASQGALVWITDVIVNGVAQVWGTDGTDIYRLFGGEMATPIKYKVQWKLSDFGLSTKLKQVLKTGVELNASTSINPTMLIENETSGTETANLRTTVPVTFVNNSGLPVTFVNNSGQSVTFVAQGRVLSRQVSNMWGAFIGWTIQGEDPPYVIQTVQLQIHEGMDSWRSPVTAGGA